MEAANALKKQTWAEAQLDKMKFPAYMGNKTQQNLANSSVEGRQSSFIVTDDRNNESSMDLTIKQEQLSDLQNNHNHILQPKGICRGKITPLVSIISNISKGICRCKITLLQTDDLQNFRQNN